MMAEVQLKSESGTLSLQIGDRDWTHVVLLLDADEHFLGADVLKIIVTRLVGALEGPHKLEVCGERDGVAVRWVLTLSETHHTIYLAVVSEGLRLYIQDQDGAMVCSIQLSDADVAQWLDQLRGCLLP